MLGSRTLDRAEIVGKLENGWDAFRANCQQFAAKAGDSAQFAVIAAQAQSIGTGYECTVRARRRTPSGAQPFNIHIQIKVVQLGTGVVVRAALSGSEVDRLRHQVPEPFRTELVKCDDKAKVSLYRFLGQALPSSSERDRKTPSRCRQQDNRTHAPCHRGCAPEIERFSQPSGPS